MPIRSSSADWPSLRFSDWSGTAWTLHRLTQIAGKIRLVQTPWTNHSWHVPLYVTARGLVTSLIPHARGSFGITFDLHDHELRIETAEGQRRGLSLGSGSVAESYRWVLTTLDDLGQSVEIHTTPSEIPDATPFERDTEAAEYDPQAARRFHAALLQMDRVFKEFRAGFIGKCSPVHFFWGSFDFAVTRFSGREAPPHPGGIPNFPDRVAREAYSHEVSSAGFWPGDANTEPIFYSYAYPTPDGFSSDPIAPDAASWSEDLGEFVLPYEAVRTADSPDEMLLTFLNSTYERAADLAKWDRNALERDFGDFHR